MNPRPATAPTSDPGGAHARVALSAPGPADRLHSTGIQAGPGAPSLDPLKPPKQHDPSRPARNDRGEDLRVAASEDLSGPGGQPQPASASRVETPRGGAAQRPGVGILEPDAGPLYLRARREALRKAEAGERLLCFDLAALGVDGIADHHPHLQRLDDEGHCFCFEEPPTSAGVWEQNALSFPLEYEVQPCDHIQRWTTPGGVRLELCCRCADTHLQPLSAAVDEAVHEWTPRVGPFPELPSQAEIERAVGAALAEARGVNLDRQIARECPECGSPLFLDRGEVADRTDPGYPPVVYCADCGMDYGEPTEADWIDAAGEYRP